MFTTVFSNYRIALGVNTYLPQQQDALFEDPFMTFMTIRENLKSNTKQADGRPLQCLSGRKLV
jgi:hypothetical protein